MNYWFVILYYPERVNTSKKPTLIIICLYLSEKTPPKIDVIVLAKGFIEDIGDAIMNLA